MLPNYFYSGLIKFGATKSPETIEIVAVCLAICAAITLYFTFLTRKNEGKFAGIVGDIYDVLTFKKLFVKPIISVTYVMATIYNIIMSFEDISNNVLGFFVQLIDGTVAIRLAYEVAMMFIGIFENTRIIAGIDPKPVPQPKPVQQPVQRPVQQYAQPVQPQQPVQQYAQPQQPAQPVQPQQQNVNPQNPIQ